MLVVYWNLRLMESGCVSSSMWRRCPGDLAKAKMKVSNMGYCRGCMCARNMNIDSKRPIACLALCRSFDFDGDER